MTSGMTEEEFLNNLQAQSAVLYQYIIMGEAIIHVDPEILKKYDYPWHLVRSFRNFIAHVYHKIKLEQVWNTTKNLSELKILLEQILLEQILKTEFK